MRKLLLACLLALGFTLGVAIIQTLDRSAFTCELAPILGSTPSHYLSAIATPCPQVTYGEVCR